MKIRLEFLDWLFTRTTGPHEIWTGVFGIITAYSIHMGTFLIQNATRNINLVVSDWDLSSVALALVIGSSTQMLGLLITLFKKPLLSNTLRWVGCVIEGSMWTVLLYFTFLTPEPTMQITFLYSLRILIVLWVVMSIAYRGFRGSCTS